MITPYLVLGLDPDASGDQVRRRYLELVKAHPAEREPDRFRRITMAYEAVKDERARVQNAILGATRYADLELALEDFVHARPPRRRSPGLMDLLRAERIADG